MEFRYSQDETHHAVRIIQRGDQYEVLIDERRYTVTARVIDAHTLDLLIDGRYVRAKHAGLDQQRWVSLGGTPHQATRLLHRSQRHSRGEESGSLAASMPGQVTAVTVTAGERVEAGDLLIVMEAMKMEMRIVAPATGTVSAVHVAAGEQVERGQILVEVTVDRA
jgi:acetyl/propionyl-CoA carboxylase alpha subunit